MKATTQAAPRPQTTLDILRAIDYPLPDLSAARQYVCALTGSADTPMAWVVPPKRGVQVAPLFLYGPLGEHAAALVQANAEGRSVECIVNRTNGKGVTAGDIEAVRALWISTDSEYARFTQAQVDAVRPKPHLIIEARPGEFDLLWIMREGECPRAEFGSVMHKLAQHFKSSRRVLALEQRFLVPGFWSLGTTSTQLQPHSASSKRFQAEIVRDRSARAGA